MKEAQPTWYTAVPTMHQAILARAGRNADIIAGRRRCASCGRPRPRLPAQVMVQLQDTFSAPVIEAYGMTEAAHQMACNPLPPRAQKPGRRGHRGRPQGAHRA